MHRPERPALWLCCAFLAGAWIEGAPHAAAAVLGAAVPLGIAAVWRLGRLKAAALLAILALFLSGYVVARDDRERRASRQRSAFGLDDEARDRELTGRLLRLPDRDARGEWRLVLEASPAGAPGAGPLRVGLRVAASPADAERAVAGLVTGDRVRVWCRLRRPASGVDGALRAAGYDATGRVKSARLVERLGGGGRAQRLIATAHLASRSRLDHLFGPVGTRRELAGAMLLGDQAALAPATSSELRSAGLSHIVAVSGFHVAIVLVAAFAVLGRAGMGPLARLAAGVFLVPAYAAFVGAQAPVRRAAAGALLALAGRTCGRDGDALNGLALIAAGLIAAEPSLLGAPAFQLTFLAVAGILILTRPCAARMPLPSPLATSVAVSLAAYAATAPVVAWHFRFLAPLAPVANLVAVPLSAVALWAGYGAIATFDSPWAGPSLARLAGWSLDSLLAVARLTAQAHAGTWVARPHAVALCAAYGALLGSIAAPPPARRATGACAATLLLVLHLGPPPPGSGPVEVWVPDVGQGQAVAVRGPRGGVVLIDAAGSHRPEYDPGARVVVPLLLDRGHRRVEALVITHEHADHAGGALALLDALEVGEVWLGPQARDSELGRRVGDRAAQRGSAMRLAMAGEQVRRGGVPIHLLAPARDARFADPNQRSVVALVGSRPNRLLVPGDIEGAGEEALLGSGSDLAAEALVLPHHGSRQAASARFLARIGARIALVSAGRENPFGHPAPETLGRARAAGAIVLRTDQAGLLWLEAGERGWTVRAP